MPLVANTFKGGRPDRSRHAILRGRHRRRFPVKCRRDVALQPFIRTWLRGRKRPGDLRLQIDIDPYSFL
jgi:primosomal protein N' (replication factor Y)